MVVVELLVVGLLVVVVDVLVRIVVGLLELVVVSFSIVLISGVVGIVDEAANFSFSTVFVKALVRYEINSLRSFIALASVSEKLNV